jgi:Lrp/AsnC family leucine-responsive transcriptional regulator
MTDFSSRLDETDWQLLGLLEHNARATFRELADQVHLSAAATAARVKNLEQIGVITGYRAIIDPSTIGRDTGAIIRLSSSSRTSSAVELGTTVGKDHPAVTAVYSVLGDCDLIFHVQACGIKELDHLVNSLGNYGATTTTVVVANLMDEATTRRCAAT